MLYSTCQQIWITQQWPQNWKRSVFTVIPRKGNAKECSNYLTTALILHTSKIIKILQARLQQHVNHEIPDVQGGFRKGREPEIKLSTSTESLKKQENSRKTSTSALLIRPKPLTVWITTNCGKFFKRWEYQITLPASWEISHITCKYFFPFSRFSFLLFWVSFALQPFSLMKSLSFILLLLSCSGDRSRKFSWNWC